MTAESLQVKLQLDISDLTAGIKKVKTQLQGMTDKVKQSIPKIGNESKKAKDALGKVGVETDSVKKKMAKLGDEAQSSLNGVVAQSRKVTQALKDMGNAGANVTIGADGSVITQSTDEVTASLGAMQSTMQKIIALDFFGVLNDVIGASKIKLFFQDLKNSFVEFKNIFKVTIKVQSDFEKTVKGIRKNIPSDKMKELKKRTDEVRESFWQLQKVNLKNLAVSIWDATKALAATIAKLGLLSAGLLAVAGAKIANSTAQFMHAWAPRFRYGLAQRPAVPPVYTA